MPDHIPRGMRGLAAARSGWDRIEEEETPLLREMTPEEGSRHWLRLQEAFAGQLEETEPVFGPERRAALIELQARLYKLKLWRESNEATALSDCQRDPAWFMAG